MPRKIQWLVIILSVFVMVSFPHDVSSGKGFQMDTVLSDAHASFVGVNAGDYSGGQVAIAGDVNGDGYDDFLIAASGSDDTRFDGGKVYLFFGNKTGWSMNMSVDEADATFIGEKSGDMAANVAGAGDVNGDGYDDFLIGSMWNDESNSAAGQTYLILGSASNWSLDTSLSHVDASFLGESNLDGAGIVAGAGDVNGDGYDDFLIGAYRNHEVDTDAGQAYLILGKKSGWAMDTHLSTADASFLGEFRNDRASRVAGGGDVNGDGYDDFLIGAPPSNGPILSSGQTYIIFGRPSGWSRDVPLSNANASFYGEAVGDQCGHSNTIIGDVNGDGFDDILISSISNDQAGVDAGQCYLIFGKATGWAFDTPISKADASFLGEAPDDLLGISVAAAGDINRDGYDDFLIGSNNGENGQYAGQTYLVFGKANGWSWGLNVSELSVSFQGENPWDFSGCSIGGGGDINGDGWGDFLIGARGSSDAMSIVGRTYLIFYNLWSDRDDDGVIDSKDAFPDNPYEYVDTDGDGVGDNLDLDMDDDGYPDEEDAFPRDPSEWNDTDGDDIGDNQDEDDDGDGFNDTVDVFPLDPREHADFDGDGVGDYGDMDDDNDMVMDRFDAFPFDGTEWLDTDGDGVGDNTDVDDDGDGYPDSEDAFPLNGGEHSDADGDGIGDALDPDDDNDGIPDDQELANEVALGLARITREVDLIESDLRRELDDLNTALVRALNDTGSELNEELRTLNESLVADLERMLTNINGNLTELNSSLSSQLDEMLETVLSDIETFQDWLDLVMGELRSQILGIDEDLSALKNSTASNLTQIRTTLGALQKLETILEELDALDASLDLAQEDLMVSVEDTGSDLEGTTRDSSDETLAANHLNMVLIVVAIILSGLIVSLLVLRPGPSKTHDPLEVEE